MVLGAADAQAFGPVYAKGKQLLQVFNNKRFYGLLQAFIIVIIDVLASFYKAQRANRANKKPTVKKLRSAIGVDYFVNKFGGKFRLHAQVVLDAAKLGKLPGCRKVHARNARPKAAGIDAQQQGTRRCIVIKLPEEPGRQLRHFAALLGVQPAYARRKCLGRLQAAIKFNKVVGPGAHKWRKGRGRQRLAEEISGRITASKLLKEALKTAAWTFEKVDIHAFEPQSPGSLPGKHFEQCL